MSAIDIAREALYGNPPTPGKKPSREGVLAAFTDLLIHADKGIAAAALSGTDLDAAMVLVQPLADTALAAQAAAQSALGLVAAYGEQIPIEIAAAVNDVLAMAADQPAFAALIIEGMTRRVAVDARALLYGIAQGEPSSLFSSTSIEAAFAEEYYRSTYSVKAAPSGLPWYFARAEAALSPAASGLLEAFGPGAPRITDAGLRIEPASANTARPGNDFTSGLWTKTGLTLAQSTAGPFGAMTRLTATSAGFHFVGQAMDSVGTVSCYVRAAGVKRVGIQIQTGAGTKKAVFDIFAGTVVNVDSGVTAWVDPGPLGTWRLVATVANTGAATVRIHALADDSSDAFPADGTKAFDLSAVQSEPGAVVTSYIDTAALAATRAIDLASIDFAPPGDFTIFAEVDLRRAETLENAIVSLIGTAPSDRVMLLRNAAGRLAVEVMNDGSAVRAVGPIRGAGIVRLAVSVRGTRTIAAIDGDTILTLSATRPPNLRTLWLGIRGTADDALNGALRTVLTIPRALSQDELSAMTRFPRPLTGGDATDTEAVRQMMIAHANDQSPHGLPAARTSIAVAESKTGIWSIAATDGFSGTDGSALGTTETGGFTWTNNNGIQRIGGRAKQPANAFAGAWITTAFSDGQVEADLYPGNGEATLYFRINAAENRFFILQRGGDGTVRLAYVFTATELLSPLISIPVVAGERWKVRCVGSLILTYRIVAGVETLIHEVTDTRLTDATKFGFRLNGTGAVDNFRLLKREAL